MMALTQFDSVSLCIGLKIKVLISNSVSVDSLQVFHFLCSSLSDAHSLSPFMFLEGGNSPRYRQRKLVLVNHLGTYKIYYSNFIMF